MNNQSLFQLLRAAIIICLYFSQFICYLAPVLVAKYWRSKQQSIESPDRSIRNRKLGNRIITLFNCAAIGIFLSMCFMGILPTVKDSFTNLQHRTGGKSDYPLGESCIVVGIILTIMVEQCILQRREEKERIQDDIEQNQRLLAECEMRELSDSYVPTYTREERAQLFVAGFQSRSNITDITVNDSLSIANTNDRIVYNSHTSLLARQGVGFSYFIFVMACGMHSIFEGITLGLQTNADKAVNLFIVISVHECFMAVALGINSTKFNYTFGAYLKYALGFSAMVPSGVIIGIIVGATPGLVSAILSAFLQGFSAGIFIHVTFQKFIPAEFSNKKDRILKVFFLLLGYFIMAVITYFLYAIVEPV